MKTTTTLTPTFIKKIQKCHAMTTRCNFRIVGTTTKTTSAIRTCLNALPMMLKCLEKFQATNNTKTITRRTNTRKNGTIRFGNRFKMNSKRTNTARNNTRMKRNTGARFTTFAKRSTNSRFNTKTRRTTGTRFTTNARRYTSAKRTRRAA